MKKQNIILIALGLLGVGYYFYWKNKKSNSTSSVDATGTPAPSTPFSSLTAMEINNKAVPVDDIYKVRFSLGKIPNTI
jgi:flagellar basal body-associated protein FliL